MTPLAVTIGWQEAVSILAAMAALAAVAAFVGSWLGRHYKEQHIIAQTRLDLDEHLRWAREKESAFVEKLEAMQAQSIRNGEQIGSLAEHVTEIADTVRATAASVNILKGAVSTVLRAGATALDNGEIVS